MPKRIFIRRSFAYFVDLLVLGLFIAIASSVFLYPFNVNIAAPGLISTSVCAPKNFVSSERMHELLPTALNGKHQQVSCTTTSMFLTSQEYAILIQSEPNDRGGNNSKRITYPVDENGNPTSVFSSEIILYLIAPFVLAFGVFKFGTSFGKRLLGVVVHNKSDTPMRFLTALKRELFKGGIFIFTGLYGLIEYIFWQPLDLDGAASWLGVLEIGGSLFWGIIVAGIMTFLGFFWYFFGSFIRWRGQAYWDRWSGTIVRKSEEPWPPNIEKG